VGRWLPPRRQNVAAPQELTLKHSLVVAPQYGPPPDPTPLKFAAAEAQFVLDTVPGEQVQPAKFDDVCSGLEKGTASLVHFVCHGSDGSEGDGFGLQIIKLESGKLTSVQLDGMDQLREAFSTHPLVFLNACEIGRPTPALVGIGGFAKAFLDAGAGAVIAPLWSVKDSCAHDIAKMFYQQLRGGGRIRPAEILRDVRRQAYLKTATTTGEDTYAAYCFYGDPQAVAFIPGATQ